MARTRVFEFDANPKTDAPHHYMKRADADRLVEMKMAAPCGNRAIKLFRPLPGDPRAARFDGFGGGWWKAGYSGPYALLQFDASEWPLHVPSSEVEQRSNGWPMRMTLGNGNE